MRTSSKSHVNFSVRKHIKAPRFHTLWLIQLHERVYKENNSARKFERSIEHIYITYYLATESFNN